MAYGRLDQISLIYTRIIPLVNFIVHLAIMAKQKFSFASHISAGYTESPLSEKVWKNCDAR